MRYMRMQTVSDGLTYAAERIVIDDMDLWSIVTLLRGHLTGRLTLAQGWMPQLWQNALPQEQIAAMTAELDQYLTHFDYPLARG